MTLEAMLEEIRALPVRDRKRLVRLMVDTLPDEDERAAAKTRSITELRGLGKELWRAIDAQEYIDQLRNW